MTETPERVVPCGAGWHVALADAVRENKGETIVVETAAMKELAERSAERVGKTVTVRIDDPGKCDVESELEREQAVIDAMSQTEMCRLHRFAPSGHKYFITDTPLNEYWQRVFKEKGGFTPAISKAIGLG